MAGIVITCLVLSGCTDAADEPRTADEVFERVDESVPLREATTNDFLMSGWLREGVIESELGVDRAEGRLRATDGDEDSALLVLERDGGFDEDFDVFVDLARDIGAPPMDPVGDDDQTLAAECCAVRAIGDLLVIAVDSEPRLRDAVLAL